MRDRLKQNTLDGTLVLAGGLALGAYSLARFHTAAVKTSWALSPWLFPLLLGVLALPIGLALLLAPGEEKQSAPQDLKRPAALLGMGALYAALLPIMHFIPASALFLAAATRFLGERRWPRIALTALLLPFALWALFGLALRVRLP